MGQLRPGRRHPGGSGGARLSVYHLGALEDSVGTLGEEVKHHKQGGWAAQKLQRHEDQEARHNLKEAAAWADGYLNQHHVERLVLAGTPENLAEFRGLLPHSLQAKVVGQTSLDTNASPAEAWEHAFQVAQAEQRQTEENLLEQVMTAARKGGAGALGLTDTLTALQRSRIHQLLVSPDLHAPGQQCISARRSCWTRRQPARIAGANWLLRRILSTWSSGLPSMRA